MSACGRYTVSISLSCLARMIEMTAAHHPHEIGTSLVGSYSDDGFDALVSDMAPLSPDSMSSQSTFVRGTKGLRAFFSRVWVAFAGNRFYVGEWHSHPNGSPVPSRLDDSNQLAISRDRKTNCPESILIIVGGNPVSDYHLGVFVYSRMRGRVDLRPAES